MPRAVDKCAAPKLQWRACVAEKKETQIAARAVKAAKHQLWLKKKAEAAVKRDLKKKQIVERRALKKKTPPSSEMARTVARNYARRRAEKVGRTSVNLKQVYVKTASNPAMGLGLFAAEPIEKGDFITEYGGVLITRTEALELRRQGQDTHLMSVRGTPHIIDGRVNKAIGINKEWFRKHHFLAAFANDPFGSALYTTNAKTVRLSQPNGYRFPQPNGQYTNVRVFLQASRAIATDEEIFINYGKRYHDLHFAVPA